MKDFCLLRSLKMLANAGAIASRLQLALTGYYLDHVTGVPTLDIWLFTMHFTTLQNPPFIIRKASIHSPLVGTPSIIRKVSIHRKVGTE